MNSTSNSPKRRRRRPISLIISVNLIFVSLLVSCVTLKSNLDLANEYCVGRAADYSSCVSKRLAYFDEYDAITNKLNTDLDYCKLVTDTQTSCPDYQTRGSITDSRGNSYSYEQTTRALDPPSYCFGGYAGGMLAYQAKKIVMTRCMAEHGWASEGEFSFGVYKRPNVAISNLKAKYGYE